MRLTGGRQTILGMLCAVWIALPLHVQAQSPVVVPDDLRQAVDAGDTVTVVVGVDASFVPESRLTASDVQVQRRAVARATGQAMGQAALAGAVIGPSLGSLPYFSARVDQRALDRLLASPGVRSVRVDELARPSLLSSLPVINVAPAWTAGYQGTGWTVAVIDTGVQFDHPFLEGKIAGEACYSNSGGAGQADGGQSVCPGGVTSSTLMGSGGPCTGATGCDHGTHVAGIAAGSNATDGSHGVAKGASIISLQVFTRFTSVSICGGPAPCVLAYYSDIVRALDRVVTLAGPGNASRIAAANLSLGNGGFTSYCDSEDPGTTAAVEALRLLGIPTVVASGNGSAVNALSWPACISSAVSVGSVSDDLGVSLFSNNAPYLSLYAPGSLIRSSVTGGGYAEFSGTSMAAPHVAGAWAVLKQARPSATVSDVLSILQTTGTMIPDGRVGGGAAHPLINVEAARASMADVSLSTARWVPPASGGSVTLTVSTRTAGQAWSATSDSAWLTMSVAGGTGSGTVTLTAESIPPVLSRTALVTIGSAVLTVTQYGSTLGFSTWTPVAAGESRSLEVSLVAEHLSWTASSSASWLTVSPASGVGTGTVTLTTADRGDFAQPRTATVTVAGRVVTVTQSGVVPTYALAMMNWPVGAAGGSTSAALSTFPADATWTTSSNVSWLAVNPPSGTGAASIVLTAAPTTSAFVRTGTATIAGQPVTVTQTAGVNTFTTSLPATWVASPAGATLGPLTVDTTYGDAPWTASSSASWVTVTPAGQTGSGSVTLTAAANTSAQARTATVTVAGRTMQVSQAGATAVLTVSPTNWTVAAGGGVQSIGVSASVSDAPWTAVSGAAWLTVSAASGTGSGTVTLTAAANLSVQARTATATVAGQTVTVTQAGGTNAFTLTPLSWAAPDGGTIGSLTIAATYSDAPWTATANVPWLIVGQGSGNGSITMNVWVVQNNGAARTGTITVAGQTVTVTQASGLRTFTVTASSVLSLPAGGGTTLVTVTASHSDGMWAAVSGAAWLTVSAASGTGSGTVTLTAAANLSVQARTATATVAGQTVTVRQTGAVPTFSLGSPSWNVPRTGGRYQVTLTSSVADAPWTASTTVPWLTVTPASGVGTTTLTVEAARMPGVAPRLGSMLVGGVSLAVTQAAPADQPIEVTVASIEQQVVTLRWVWAGPPPDGYVIAGGYVPGSEVASLQTGSNEPMVRFTAPRGTFYICVFGLRNGERLVPSDDIRISVDVPEPPSAPTHLLGLANGRALELTWLNTRNGGTPTVSVLEVSGTISGVVSLPLTERFSFPDVPGGIYTFRVRAANSSGGSPASNPVTLTFPGTCERPAVPDAFQTYVVGDTVTLRWNPPTSGPAVTGYDLLVTGAASLVVPLDVRQVITGAPPGTYFVSVSATNACGAGPATGTQAVVVP